MDASSSVAAASAGGLVAISWVAASSYLFWYDKRENGVTKGKSHQYSWTFHVESLRLFAFINLVIVLAVGALITEKSGLDTIPDPTKTVIFGLFGINHSCNWVDHNPARMIAAVLVLPLVQVPLMLYTILWHCRLAKDVMTGKVPKWLLNVSRVLTPFNFITFAELHLWFVNNPDDTYGFTGHYIPYLMFQISMCLHHSMNIIYLSLKGNLPWGIPSWLAWTGFSVFTAISIFYAIFVISTLAGKPLVAASRSSGEEIITRILVVSWAVSALIGTVISSGKERLNGDVMTLKLGDHVLSLENTSNGKDDNTKGDGGEDLEEQPQVEPADK